MNQTIKNIIAIRKKLKISQLDIADAYNVAGSAISKIENGNRKIELEFLITLSELFDMSIDEIVNYHLPKEEKVVNPEDHPVTPELLAFIKQEEGKLEAIYQESLKNKSELIAMLTEQRDFYKERYQEAKDMLTKQNKDLEAQANLIDKTNAILDRLTPKG